MRKVLPESVEEKVRFHIRDLLRVHLNTNTSPFDAGLFVYTLARNLPMRYSPNNWVGCSPTMPDSMCSRRHRWNSPRGFVVLSQASQSANLYGFGSSTRSRRCNARRKCPPPEKDRDAWQDRDRFQRGLPLGARRKPAVALRRLSVDWSGARRPGKTHATTACAQCSRIIMLGSACTQYVRASPWNPSRGNHQMYSSA